ncbi:hypothetical protein BDV95DRAFT_490184 [Massariosphaeria phaeospora]|uniref:Uncharacterized protein n=1 Tax=Massariosphaeria phaeospora TaxID=100035 RepID=A0A7C8I9Y4_9PLEO|nr:hypothetical protein BDV95DRAFT_490184 [Massariosphaeria phaeospora]
MSTSSSSKHTVHKAPLKAEITKPSVILYGSIDKNNWHSALSASLAHLPITVLDPRRDDWDSSWIEDVSFPKFKEQVEWEMDHAQVADVIVFYFAPGTLAPIALLELGMYAATGKVVVCCPKDFYKRGNVHMVCDRYGIQLIETMEELQEHVREKLGEKLRTIESS